MIQSAADKLNKKVEQLVLTADQQQKQRAGDLKGGVSSQVEGEESGEVPTLRRKEKKNMKGGPRVTRNITDEEVVTRLSKLCIPGLPWQKYKKVGKERINIFVYQKALIRTFHTSFFTTK